jgi:Ca-activated chloride channel homolog
MIFVRAWVLILALAPLVWVAWTWRANSRKLQLLLKGLALALLLLAISEPVMNVRETKLAVAILADTSASITGSDLAQESAVASKIVSARGRHWTRIVPFARSTRDLDKSENLKPVKLGQTAGEAGRGTDLETAVREGVAALPAGLVPRLVLISDGKENRGSLSRAAWQARQLGIPIDTYAVPGRPKAQLALEAASIPAVAFTGDKFAIDVVVRSQKRSKAQVEISAEGKVLGSSEVNLDQGENHIRVHTAVAVPGAFDLTGRISAPGMGEVRFSQAVAMRRPKVLLISGDPEGTEHHILQVLDAARFDVDRTAKLDDAALPGYQVVVLNNQDLEMLSTAHKSAIEAYIKQGGGVLVIGGENNRYLEKAKDKPEDPLERALPAKLAPPRTPEGTCVVLIVDKSSSMEGKKIELARMAAIGVIENLRPIDSVGVLIFDNSFQWAVPIRKAEDKSLIKRLVAGITPDGGTQIAPALTEAYRRILPQKAIYKHIVLLTDGISEEGDSMGLSKEAAAQRITISTVGLGQDVNRAFLERVAGNAKGKSYFLTDPSGLEQLLLKDVMEHTGTTAIEKAIAPEILKKAEILEGVPMESAPNLRGYVKFVSKPSAETILQIEKKDPLLARWQYGLGRAMVFTSDAKSRWAKDWVSWPGFDRFWSNVFRDLLPHAQSGEATADYDRAKGELMVDYRLAPHIEEPAAIPDIFALGPDGFRSPVAVKKVAAGAYHGQVQIGSRTGLFRIRPLAESREFPEVGFYLPESEMLEYGSDEFLLKQVAEFTGGRFQPQPAAVFDSGGKSIASSLRLWPGLLALAILLNLIELVIRKWPGILPKR